MNHDIIVLGGSAGAIEVMLDLVTALPGDLPASIFVTIHTAPGRVSSLPELLDQRGPMRVVHPQHGDAIQRGTIYVAPPDVHLQLGPHGIEVVRGPKDNGHRPAVDVLFRTAAAAYGGRAVAGVLTGYGDCGTAGMMSIRARGGLGFAQDPATAYAPDMPRHTIERAGVDHVVEPRDFAALLVKLAASPAGPTTPPPLAVRQLDGEVPGAAVELVCPLCDGVLTEVQPGQFQHFRCHVGHAFTLESLVREQTNELERVLWAAVRSLEESAALARRVAKFEPDTALKARFFEKASDHDRQVGYLRRLLLVSGGLDKLDAVKID